MLQNVLIKTDASVSWVAKCRLSHKPGKDPNCCNMEPDFSKTSFVWFDKHTMKWPSKTSALSGLLAPKPGGSALSPLPGDLLLARYFQAAARNAAWITVVHTDPQLHS